MSFTPSKSTVKDDTLVAFLYSDITSDLECVPGIGPKCKEELQSHGIENTYQLIAKFLAFKTEDLGVVEHCNTFFAWLGEIGIKTNRHNITKSLAEKIAISYPQLYAETCFMDVVSKTDV